jgi:hypothetical protein
MNTPRTRYIQSMCTLALYMLPMLRHYVHYYVHHYNFTNSKSAFVFHIITRKHSSTRGEAGVGTARA